MSGIDNVKKGMGWVNANARAACGNCNLKQEEAHAYSAPTLRCSAGGFQTTRFAICDKYTPIFLTGGASK